MHAKSQNDPTKTDFTELARHILRYLQANPQAADTLEGIVEWWLLQEKIEAAVEKASRAITWLVANGYLLEKKISGSKTLYEVNPTKRDEIVEFLRNVGDAKP